VIARKYCTADGILKLSSQVNTRINSKLIAGSGSCAWSEERDLYDDGTQIVLSEGIEWDNVVQGRT